MKNACRLLAMGLVLAGISGCGDTSNVLLHDIVVFWNEVCDNMLRATDEATAKDLLNVQFKLLEKKHLALKSRVEARFKDLKEKEEGLELDNAILDRYYEIEATEKRLISCKNRLAAIIANTPSSHQKLEEVMNWPDKRKDFNKIPLGAYMPPRIEDPNVAKHLDLEDPARVKQLKSGANLVPARPQIKQIRPAKTAGKDQAGGTP